MENRVIKFNRLFFKGGKFVYSSTWGVGIDGASFKSPSNNNFSDSFIDCQFTGVLDKTGKEIYESDKNQYGGIVFYNNETASFLWDYGEGSDIQEFCDEKTWCEIIGNIYETTQ